MAGAYQKPKFHWDYKLEDERSSFDKFFADKKRAIPEKKSNQIDLASWNIANLGVQKRRPKDLRLIAHVISKFDIIAVQEISANLTHFNKIMSELGSVFDMRMTDVAGTNERLAVIYRKEKIRPRQLFGELDYNPNGKIELEYNPNGKIIDKKYIIPPFKQSFTANGKKYDLEFYNFNRNPFLSSWEVIGQNKSFLLANCHIYFGKESKTTPHFINRVAEVFYVANWAREQQKKAKKHRTHIYEKNIIVIGDMNIPKMESADPVYRALMRRGMKPSKYATVAGFKNEDFKFFDQIVFTNNKMKVKQIQGKDAVVVDFDNFMFRDLWADVKAEKRTEKQFRAWCQFAISDHRPLFVRLKV